MRLAPLVAATALLVFLGACVPQDSVEAELPTDSVEAKIPSTIGEAVGQLRILYSEAEIEEIRRMSESDFLAQSHFGLGMHIRNEWGLWAESELALYFNKLGLSHADDMSAIILCCFWRDLNDVAYAVEDQAQCYRDWWEEFRRLQAESELDSGSLVPNFTCPDREALY